MIGLFEIYCGVEKGRKINISVQIEMDFGKKFSGRIFPNIEVCTYMYVLLKYVI